MFVLIRYILVAAAALPQGLCCIATGCSPCSRRDAENTNPIPVCCKCDHLKSETSRKVPIAPGSKKCSGPKSCECRCRIPHGVLSTPVSMDTVALCLAVFDRTIESNGCLTQKNKTDVTIHPFVRLQILYCIWRC